tara:strand:+ start:36258 stop:40403 length:4146 start_codon:yes stop_codon:yes gene_type:complete
MSNVTATVQQTVKKVTVNTPQQNKVITVVSGDSVTVTPAVTPNLVSVESKVSKVTVETSYAPKNSPNLTGNPTAPTQSFGDNSTKLATTAFVQSAVESENTIAELNDVNLTSIADNELLQYDSTSGKFRNRTINELGFATSTNLTAHTVNVSNPHNVTKSQVGLGNVDNTSDVNKPISSATQTALNAKAPLASPSLTGNPTAPTQSAGDSSTKIATTAFVTSAINLENSIGEMDDVSITSLGNGELLQYDSSSSKWLNKTISELGLATSSNLTTHTSSTSNPHSVTATQVGLGNVTNESKSTMFTSPVFTGNPTAVTQSAGDNSTKLATTAYVDSAIGTENELSELNDVSISSLSDDEIIQYDTTTSRWINKTFSEAGIATTASLSSHTDSSSNPHNVTASQVGLGNVTNESKATMLTSPALTGSPTAPTQSAGDNSTKIATTQFVTSAINQENQLVELNDVTITGVPADNALLAYDSTSSKWINQTATQAGLATSSSLASHTSSTSNPHGVTASQVGLGNVTNESKANMFADPVFTGNPVAPTQGASNNSTRIATTQYVTTAIANVLDSAPAALDTLNELASALGDDSSFSSSVTNSLALKAPLASPSLTGTPTAPTASSGTNTTQLATTQFVTTAVGNVSFSVGDLSNAQITSISDDEVLQYNSSTSKWINRTLSEAGIASISSLTSHTSSTSNPHSVTKSQVGLGNVDNESKATMFSSPTFTGTVTIPTPASSDNSTKAASTAFVKAQSYITSSFVSISNATDVHLSSISDGEILVYDNSDSRFENRTLSEVGIATTSSLSSHTASTGNPHSVNAEQVGLGNVTNESKATMFANSTFTGTPVAPTPSAGNNTTRLATTAFVTTAIGNITASDVGLGNVTNESKSTILASPALTGNPTAPTQSSGDNSTKIATTQFVQSAVTAENELSEMNDVVISGVPASDSLLAYGSGAKWHNKTFAELGIATLANPAFGGTPTAPTPSTSDNSTKIATTAFVQAVVDSEDTLAEMGDIVLNSLGNGELLQYNSSTSKWENKTLAELGISSSTNLATHTNDTTNPHSVTASQVGLGNVANESKSTMFTSAALTGTPTAPTASSSTNSTQIATTAYVTTAVSNLVDSSPDTLNTLNELAAALGDDANFSTTITNSIGTKLPLAGGTLTGNVTFNDDVKARFGSDNDFDIYHNNTNAVLENGSGDILIGADTVRFKDENLSSSDRFVVASNGSVGVNTSSPQSAQGVKLEVNGQVKHGGLIMSSGNAVDMLRTESVSVTISPTFQDTGINGSNTPLGTYAIQVHANDSSAGGQSEVYYSGIMAFYGGTTSDDGFSSEIDLHRAGGGDNDRTLFLRTISSSTTNNVKLQISANYTGTQAHTFTFKLRRLI